MRLAYITNIKIPSKKAHTIQVLKMSESFVSLVGEPNYQLVVPDRWQSPASSAFYKLYALSKTFPITRLPVLDFLDFIPENFLSLKRLAFYLEVISFAFSAFFFCLINRPSLIYTRDFYLLPLLLFLGRPLYYEAHYFPATRFGLLLHQLVLPRLSGVIAITNGFKTHFDQNGIGYKKIMVAHDASDPAFFGNSSATQVKALRHDLNLGQNLIIGYIGRLSGIGENKGGDLLLQAFNRLKRRHKNLVLLIVGGSDEDLENLKKMAPPGLLSRVVFTGEKPYNQMPQFFKLIDIGVIPFSNRPHFRYFMSPLKLFDYFAAGKPVVTSDLPSVREVMDQSNGVFFTPADTHSLTIAMNQLVLSPQKRKSLGLANLKKSKELTWPNRAAKILQFVSANGNKNP